MTKLLQYNKIKRVIHFSPQKKKSNTCYTYLIFEVGTEIEILNHDLQVQNYDFKLRFQFKNWVFMQLCVTVCNKHNINKNYNTILTITKFCSKIVSIYKIIHVYHLNNSHQSLKISCDTSIRTKTKIQVAKTAITT